MRFIFTSSFTSAASGENSLFGREILQLHPQGFIGLGDWNAATVALGALVSPDERLDVLDRTVRIRRLIPDFQDDALDAVVVSDADGRLHWRDANTLSADCDWEVTGTADVVTAFDPAPLAGCPGEPNLVGIGVDLPEAKLHVLRTLTDNPLLERAGFFHASCEAQYSIGVEGLSDRTNPINVGGRGIARNAGRAWGLWGLADSPTNSNTGVRADAVNGIDNTGVVGSAQYGNRSFGVSASGGGGTVENKGLAAVGYNGIEAYGISTEAWGGTSANYGIRAYATGTNAWAGWFDGDVHITGDASCTAMAWTSDASLKTDIEDIENALETVGQLRPTTYLFAPTPAVNALPEGLQRGFVAQELETVLPDLVRGITYPAQFDSLGNTVQEEVTVKGVNYIGLIPMLTASIQEQQAHLVEQAARLDQLEAALAACCTNHGGVPDDQRSGTIQDELPLDPATERLLTIAPNPFTDHTTVSYVLERGGRAQLLVNSSDGKHLQVLNEAERSEGQYSYAWSTAHLASGVYYVTLLLDGEPLVKRAVKVQ